MNHNDHLYYRSDKWHQILVIISKGPYFKMMEIPNNINCLTCIITFTIYITFCSLSKLGLLFSLYISTDMFTLQFLFENYIICHVNKMLPIFQFPSYSFHFTPTTSGGLLRDTNIEDRDSYKTCEAFEILKNGTNKI